MRSTQRSEVTWTSERDKEGESMKRYLAVDIGGTAVKWAVVSEEFQMEARGEFPTPYTDAEDLSERVAAISREQKEALSGIGISVPGTLQDEPDGVIDGGGVLTYLHRAPFGKLVREKSGLPCFVENDGKSCALGEYADGALKGCRVGVVMVLGTGIGGGIVIDGQVFKGVHAFAGEFSFLTCSRDASLDFGHIFGFYGGWKNGLLAEVLRRKGLPEDTEMNGRDIFRLINGGDREAMEALRAYSRGIAAQIHNLQAILDPELFAIGGGISAQPALLDAIQEALDSIYRDSPFPQFPIPRVVRCEHGGDANLLGAVYQCVQRIRRKGA